MDHVTPEVGRVAFPSETRWWTHGLPPQSGTVTAAAQRIPTIGRYRPARLPRRLDGTTGATRAVRPGPSACRSSRLARAGARRQPGRPRGRGLGPSDSPATGGRGSTPGSTSRPTPLVRPPSRRWRTGVVPLSRGRRPARQRRPPRAGDATAERRSFAALCTPACAGPTSGSTLSCDATEGGRETMRSRVRAFVVGPPVRLYVERR